MISLIIIGITSLYSILAFQNRDLFSKSLFNACQIKSDREWQRFFTYALVHADWPHLLVNMYSLYLFGQAVEDYFGILFNEKAMLYFILLYLGGIVLSVYPAFEKHKNDYQYNAVGASGAVSAVVFSCIVIAPQMKLMFIFLPIPMPAFVFGGLYLFYSWYMAKRGADGIGHDAHFWGAIFGIVFTFLLMPRLVPQFFDKIMPVF